MSMSRVYRIQIGESAPAVLASNAFPALTTQPTVADYLPSPAHTYYCATTGDNSTGDGSIGNPWLDLIGAQSGGAGTAIGAGDLLLFRGGTYPGYPYENFSRSTNMLTTPGTSEAPIVISNYPGEIAAWDYTDHWCMTLDGDWQYLVGTMVGGEYGIQINGGITVRDNNQKVVGIEFTSGSYNGGDGNPAMLSVPLYEGCDNLLVSHNYFHDAVNYEGSNRMNAFTTFVTTNLVVEYNVFENNNDVWSEGGNMNFKDRTTNATVRYNKFLNSEAGVGYQTQNTAPDGIEIHHNLFYAVKNPIVYAVMTGEDVLIHSNVALEIPDGYAFFTYRNSDNEDFTAHGEFYDNVIDGPGLRKSWHENSSDPKNLPDLFDYNLWVSAADRDYLTVWPTSTREYHAHALTDADAIASLTYDAVTKTVTAPADWAYTTSGRTGGCIGGFSWS